jgi:hypothetical protein
MKIQGNKYGGIERREDDKQEKRGTSEPAGWQTNCGQLHGEAITKRNRMYM